MSLFDKFLIEMAAARNIDKNKTYYHGTPTEAAINGIIKNGITAPDLTDRKGFLKPVKGKVYLTPDLKYAITYCLGANILGHEYYDKEFKRSERYGYICVISGNELIDIQPDEDSVGEFVAYKKVTWLTNLAHRVLTTNTLNKIYDGEYSWWAKAGKTLVNKMTDDQKLELISLGAHIAHEGTIRPYEYWKFDKLNSVKLKSDGSNFFELAEKIKG